MAQFKYKALFSNGTVLNRSSDREYSHAWLVITSDGSLKKGFSKNRQLAEAQVSATKSAVEFWPSRGTWAKLAKRCGHIPGGPTGRRVQFSEVVKVTR